MASQHNFSRKLPALSAPAKELPAPPSTVRGMSISKPLPLVLEQPEYPDTPSPSSFDKTSYNASPPLPPRPASSHGSTASLTKESPPEEERYLSGVRLVSVLLSLTLGTFLVALDISIVAVIIPQISTDFGALDQIGWYGSAYLLTVTALQPAAGKLYKFWDLKPVYLVSIVIFEIGSAMCAAAPRSEILILGRAITGVGAAGVIQGGFGAISLIAPMEKRPVYIGLVASTFGISACVSPTLGGVLTDKIGWRWCFWMCEPFAPPLLSTRR